MKPTQRNALFTATCLLAFGYSASATAEKPLDDLEIAHAAYNADLIDIKYANIALEKSQDPDIREFAKLMVQDHTAVNEGAAALLKKLGATPKDNPFSKALNKGADTKVAEFSKLEGKAFDKAYADNELGYHQVVNKTVAGWIQIIKTPELKTFMQNALVTFKVHEDHAGQMVNKLANNP